MNLAQNRWFIAAGCCLLMVCLGTVYAWSFFQKPVVDGYGWSNSQVAWGFSLAICFLGMAAAFGGLLLPKVGPTRLAILGSTLFSCGYLLAATALRQHSLLLLYLGFGVVGGSGLGLGYVTPVATVAKWFPERKGLATGLVVMGFGFGAVLMSKIIAPQLLKLCNGDIPSVFAAIGWMFLVVTIPVAAVIRNPPPGVTAGSTPGKAAENTPQPQLSRVLLSPGFALLWLIFFCNITAGIAIIGFQSPLFQEIAARHSPDMDRATLASYGATLIAVSSLFNGVGRIFWGTVSDRIGRTATFRIILCSQLLAFALLMRTGNPWFYAFLICYVLLCYGGGFGTMPSLILDRYGSRLMPAVYGAVLTAWSVAGVTGPQLVALIKDRYPELLYPGKSATLSFAMGGCFLLSGLLISFLIKDDADDPVNQD